MKKNMAETIKTCSEKLSKKKMPKITKITYIKLVLINIAIFFSLIWLLDSR